ncbi:hypothetical protein GRI89_16230 [Altererythrobacter salegens]|uniref:Tetratricopeptide repeat protein n=1 Tax=Croceibacterium salegens TaxID=1737568 RepID=A0A6I4SYN3_9SPHN|nr:hypothetical protein [Croceibacterium salegens]MXO61091.1 hypothetical protein [Croceibacterium salegens]
MKRTTGAAALALAFAAQAAFAQDKPAAPEVADHAADTPEAAHEAHEVRLVAEMTELLPGYGGGGFAITTSVPEAQAFFSNGMELGAAFAHSAAKAAMQEAVRLDPACAMCKWGQALVTGPTINFGLDADERAEFYPMVREAARIAARNGTAKEKALTAALVERFRPGDTAARDHAYVLAMQGVQNRYPEDNEIAVLTADAMLVDAFNGWQGDADEDSVLAEVRKTLPLLETVLARAPDHTPAIHFYIHATEVVGEPGKAEPFADKLAGLAPHASHLVHMPAHTWYWVGRYEDAALTNRRAVEIGKANAKRLGMMEHNDAFNLPYHAHNVIYGLGGALMAGDSAVALELARPLIEAANKQDEVADAGAVPSATAQLLMSSGYFAYARFDPAAVAGLAEPDLPYLKAAWHYARGEAAAWDGDAAAVRVEAAAIPDHIADDPKSDDVRSAETMLGVLRGVLEGRVARLEGDLDAAAKAYRTAAEFEESKDFNDFTDPPAFWYPVRRDLAAVLLAQGDAAGAEREAQISLRMRMKDPVAEAILAGARAALGGS